MGLGSIILGVFALLCLFAGIVTTPLPFVGTMLSFLAPLLALAGIVLGGVGMSRARQDGESDGLSIAGVIVSAVAFFPAIFVALTCGICSMMCTGAMLSPHPSGAASTPFWARDAGAGASSPFDMLFPDAGTPAGAAPPGAFPPPPIMPDVHPMDSTGEPAPPGPSAVDPSAVDPSAVDPSAVDPSAGGPSAGGTQRTPSAQLRSGAHTPGAAPTLPPPPLPAGPSAP